MEKKQIAEGVACLHVESRGEAATACGVSRHPAAALNTLRLSPHLQWIEIKKRRAPADVALVRLGRLRPEVPRKLTLWGGPKLLLPLRALPTKSECAPRLHG